MDAWRETIRGGCTPPRGGFAPRRGCSWNQSLFWPGRSQWIKSQSTAITRVMRYVFILNLMEPVMSEHHGITSSPLASFKVSHQPQQQLHANLACDMSGYSTVSKNSDLPGPNHNDHTWVNQSLYLQLRLWSLQVSRKIAIFLDCLITIWCCRNPLRGGDHRTRKKSHRVYDCMERREDVLRQCKDYLPCQKTWRWRTLVLSNKWTHPERSHVWCVLGKTLKE